MELRPADALKEWKNGKFRPVYYFFGEETSARQDALAALKRLFNADSFNLREFDLLNPGEAADAVTEASTLPVFADKRLVLIKNPKLSAEARAALAEYLKDPLPSTTLALFSEEKKADLKDALTKAASQAGALVVFAPMRDEEAARRLQEEARKAGKTLSDDAAEALVAEAGTEWGVLRQELEKALLFSKGADITREDALACLGYRKAADPFLLARLVQERKLKESLGHFKRLLREGKADEQSFRALSQVSGAVLKQLKAKRMLRAGKTADEVFRALRLHAYWDRGYLDALKGMREARLARDLRRCVETEAALKSQSWLDPSVEVERLLAELCSA